MVLGTIYNQLVKTLEENKTLKVYMKQTFKGVRWPIEPDSMPCIMVEIVRDGEIERDFGQIKKVWAEFDILTFINCLNPEYAIVSNPHSDYQGIINVVNDIRACLQSSYTLGDNVEDLRFDPIEFDYTSFPVKGARIHIKTLYKQTDSV